MIALLAFCDGLPERSLAAGEIFIREGGRANKLFVLIEGEIEVLKRDTVVTVQSEPGVLFGEMSVLLELPHTATVRAAQPSRVYVVEDAVAFLQARPELSFHLAKLLARKLNSITTYLADLKSQFEDRQDHLGMVDEVLENLLHQTAEEASPGSERYPDTSI